MSNYNCLTMMILRKCRANYEELTSLINTIQVIPIQNLTHNVTFPLPLPYPVKYPVHSRIPFTFRAQFSLFSFPSCTKASYLFSFSLKIFKTSATMIFIRSVLSRNNNFSFRRIPYNLACVSHVFPSIYIYYT